MERINEEPLDLIDLGAASVQTQGMDEGVIEGVGLQLPPNLSND